MYVAPFPHSASLLHTNTFPSSAFPQGDSSVMSRAQTDETKGWMQIVILVYHYVGGKEVVGRGERGGRGSEGMVGELGEWEGERGGEGQWREGKGGT